MPELLFLADHLGGMLVHLAARTYRWRSSRAPIMRSSHSKRMGWRFPWVSSYGSDFNRDYHVSFTPEERASGTMYYNYGPFNFPVMRRPAPAYFQRRERRPLSYVLTYARLGMLLGAVQLPRPGAEGTKREGIVPHPMAWAHHDRCDSPEARPQPLLRGAGARETSLRTEERSRPRDGSPGGFSAAGCVMPGVMMALLPASGVPGGMARAGDRRGPLGAGRRLCGRCCWF
jgi:hypothetical protein